VHASAASTFRRVASRAARSLAAGLAAAALLAGCGGGEPPLSVVLLTLDTTNRDALGCFGQALPLTPALDRLAAEGIAFDQARTVAPLTLPAHGSMLTGLVPLRHGVHDNALVPIPAEAETLAERLAAAGFQTAAFVSAVVLAAPYGLDQGFQVYDAPAGTAAGPTAHMLARPGGETVRRAGAWLEARERDRPFFLWVHLFEPHEPYEPPEDCLALARGNPYLGEVAALDRAVAALRETLERAHGLERLLLVVAADHGEMLGDHGERTHSVLCYERVLRVPLLVRLPGGARAGERSGTPVSVTDVFPTVLEVLGMPPVAGLDGQSLVAPRAPVGSFFESYTGYLNYGWSPLVGWTDGRWKYVHGTAPELFDLERDPGELQNLFPEGAGLAPARAALGELAARPRLVARGATDESLAEDVRALGYAGSASAESALPEPLAETGRPAPRTRLAELERFYRAVLRYNNGKRAEAIADLEGLLAENPGNTMARRILASYLLGEDRAPDALAVLEQLAPEARGSATAQDLFGHCLERLGRTEEARAHFARALELKPGDAHQEEDLARLARASGR